MNKIVKIGIPILLIIITLAPTTVEANFNVAVGNSFTYDVAKSNWDLTSGLNSASVKGFEFEDVNFAEKTQFNLLVTTATGVVFDITVETITDTDTHVSDDIIGMIFALIYPLFLAETLSLAWNQTKMDLGPSLLALLFIDPVLFSNFYIDFANEAFVSTEVTDADWIISNIGGTFDNSSTITVFEWHFDMTFTNGGLGHNFGGTYTYIHAFDKTTGELKGFYMDIDYSGQMDFSVTDIKLEQLIEQEGYNLPGVSGLPGFNWYLAIPTFTLLIGIPIIIKRRK